MSGISAALAAKNMLNPSNLALVDGAAGAGTSAGVGAASGAGANLGLNLGLSLASAAVAAGAGAWKNNTLSNLNSRELNEYKSLYGRGNDPIFDLFSLSSDRRNTINGVKNYTYNNTGAMGNLQDAVNQYQNIDFDAFNHIEKPEWDTVVAGGLEAAGKGASIGSMFGPWGALIGAGIGTVADAAKYIGSGKARRRANAMKDAQKELSITNYNNMLGATKNQMNLNEMRNYKPYSLGGALDYSIQNQFMTNNTINALNKGKITSLPNSFQKPQFESMNYFALGGNTDFNEFNTGGTHEENPLGGVLQGIDEQGNPKVVEQGETKTSTPQGDYVFSDRLKLSKEECNTLKVPIGSTYAEASKILRKEYDEKPNDEIARKGWEQVRDILIQSQELQKQEIAAKEARQQNLTSPKEFYGVSPKVSNSYNQPPSQEEASLQQDINPNIKQYGLGDWLKKNLTISPESFQYAPLIGNGIGLLQNLATKEDYQMIDEYRKERNNLPTVSVPKVGSYMTYNPIDINSYINEYNAQTAGQRNTIMNNSNPNKQSLLLANMYNSNIGYGNLIKNLEQQNAEEKRKVLEYNNNLDQINAANQLSAAQINQQYNKMKLDGIMQELATRDAIQTARANAIQSNLQGLTDNLYNVYRDSVYDRQADVWMQGQSIPTNLGMQVADKSISPQAAKQLLLNYYNEEKVKEIMSNYTLDGKPLDITGLFGG